VTHQMPQSLYLVDRSAWLQVPYSADAKRQLYILKLTGGLATCAIIEAELLYAARDRTDFAWRRHGYSALHRLAMTEQIHARALDIMQALADYGQHRSVPIPDMLIAATAEAYGATLLHYDQNFERIAQYVPVSHEWIVEPGAGRVTP
jgi:predicted nucleic acid-binding protein